MYSNSLAPSKLFAIVLELFSAAAMVMWLGFLLDVDETAFDLGGWIVLGSALGFFILSVLFFRRVRWARVFTSVLLHILILGAIIDLGFIALDDELVLAEKMTTAAMILLAIGLLVVGILVLHGNAMKHDLTGVTPPQVVRHRRRTGILVVTGCLLLLLALVAWRIVPLLIAKPTISVDYLAQANELIKPADYDPNRNAAPHYEKLFTEFTPLPEILQHKFKAWPTELILNEYEALKEWAPVNEALLPVLAQAAQCPYWWYELKSEDGSLGGFERPDIDSARKCVHGLILLAKYKASRGDIDGALQLLADVHMVGMHHIAGPTLLPQLTGAAICEIVYDDVFAIMDHCRINKEPLRRTLTVFASRLPLTDVPRFTEVEHLLMHDHMQRVFTDDGDGSGRLIPPLMYEWKKNRRSLFTYPVSYLDAVRICLTHPSREETTRMADISYAVMKGLAEQSPWDLHAQDTSCYEVIDKLLSKNYYLYQMAPATAECIDVGWRNRALGRGVTTVLAILAYRAQEGRLPGSLDQLVNASLLQEVPMDPYGDGPLVYKVTGEDFTLYSVGEDFVDDEGVHCEWDDWTGGDHVFWPVHYPGEIQEEGEQL